MNDSHINHNKVSMQSKTKRLNIHICTQRRYFAELATRDKGVIEKKSLKFQENM